MPAPSGVIAHPAPHGGPTLADRIRDLVDAAPPLSSEQRDRLSILLRGDSA